MIRRKDRHELIAKMICNKCGHYVGGITRDLMSGFATAFAMKSHIEQFGPEHDDFRTEKP